MSNQLQTKEELSEEEKEAKAAIMKCMTGEEGLEVFTRALREEGIVLPKNDIWKYARRKHVEAATHATFSMLGGVPGMVKWAMNNPNTFYPAYMKMMPVESGIVGTGQIVINTGMEASRLDAVEIDPATGQVMNSVNSFQFKDDE